MKAQAQAAEEWAQLAKKQFFMIKFFYFFVNFLGRLTDGFFSSHITFLYRYFFNNCFIKLIVFFFRWLRKTKL